MATLKAQLYFLLGWMQRGLAPYGALVSTQPNRLTVLHEQIVDEMVYSSTAIQVYSDKIFLTNIAIDKIFVHDKATHVTKKIFDVAVPELSFGMTDTTQYFGPTQVGDKLFFAPTAVYDSYGGVTYKPGKLLVYDPVANALVALSSIIAGGIVLFVFEGVTYVRLGSTTYIINSDNTLTSLGAAYINPIRINGLVIWQKGAGFYTYDEVNKTYTLSGTMSASRTTTYYVTASNRLMIRDSAGLVYEYLFDTNTVVLRSLPSTNVTTMVIMVETAAGTLYVYRDASYLWKWDTATSAFIKITNLPFDTTYMQILDDDRIFNAGSKTYMQQLNLATGDFDNIYMYPTQLDTGLSKWVKFGDYLFVANNSGIYADSIYRYTISTNTWTRVYVNTIEGAEMYWFIQNNRLFFAGAHGCLEYKDADNIFKVIESYQGVMKVFSDNELFFIARLADTGSFILNTLTDVRTDINVWGQSFATGLYMSEYMLQAHNETYTLLSAPYATLTKSDDGQYGAAMCKETDNSIWLAYNAEPYLI